MKAMVMSGVVLSYVLLTLRAFGFSAADRADHAAYEDGWEVPGATNWLGDEAGGWTVLPRGEAFRPEASHVFGRKSRVE